MSEENDKNDDKTEENAPEPASANPEDIARRVAALGGEDELDRVARLEEEKLAARRQVGKKKKGGLEVAASKKLAKIGTRAEPRRNVAVASDADPLIERTAKLSDWAKQNQKTVQILGGLVAAALLGVAGFLYIDHKHEIEASVMLAKAVSDERARIGEPPKDDEEGDGQPVFKTYDERRESALKKYKDVEARFPKSGAAILARLSEGSLLLDKRDPAAAMTAFGDVKQSALAMADQEVKGRALEGIGFAYELLADKDAAQAQKHREDAMKTYKELENTVEIRGFKEIAMYHQARVLMAQGEKDKAKDLLKSLRERLDKPDEGSAVSKMGIPLGPSFPFLSEVVQDRLHQIDPSEAPQGGGPRPGGGGGLPKGITPAQMKQLEEMMKKQGKMPPGGGH